MQYWKEGPNTQCKDYACKTKSNGPPSKWWAHNPHHCYIYIRGIEYIRETKYKFVSKFNKELHQVLHYSFTLSRPETPKS